jgi:hypothetical protein
LPDASSSITLEGGTRPPGPMTVSSIVTPGPPGVTVGEAISVVARLVLVGPPGRNSVTTPDTVTASPTATAPPIPVAKTRIASDVATFPSPTASCSVKLFGRSDVTTPLTETVRPTSGETCGAPCTCGIVVTSGTVVNENTRSAVIVSGGSSLSTSATRASSTVTVHVSPTAKPMFGFRA